MAKNLFSVPIFFIVFRETLEAAIIVSVLLGLAEQIVHDDSSPVVSQNLEDETNAESTRKEGSESSPAQQPRELTSDNRSLKARLTRKLRFQIFLGAGLGLLLALVIGAAFLAVWFTKASNLWAKSEELWEGIFGLIASLMIFGMGVTMLRMDRAKAKWRIKLHRAFYGQQVDGKTKTGKWVLFILPFITVLREGDTPGLEAVVFVGGVSLGQPATSIPIAAIVGILCGLICGFVIYEFASRITLTIFLVFMTNFLLLIGAGLFSKATGAFEKHAFNTVLGGDAGEARGDGPGTYRVQGNVWHLNCCNPDNHLDAHGWTIFSALFGWTNNATIGSVLAYVFYWLAVIVVLIYMKHTEGRTKLVGRESAAGARRRIFREERDATHLHDTKSEGEGLPR